MITAIATQKGGEAKTTTTAVLMNGLARRGYSVLAIDIDPQGNLTNITCGDNRDKTVLGILMRECTAKEAVQELSEYGCCLIPAKQKLASIDQMLEGMGKAFRLKEALDEIRDDYDHILIDCPPQLGTLTANALTAADQVLIPTQADISSIQGLSQIWNTIREAKQYTNPNLQIIGILLTRYTDRTKINRHIIEELKTVVAPKLDTTLFDSTIREAIAVKEARYKRMPLFEYAPKNNVTKDYEAFVDEFVERSKRIAN